MKNNGNSAEQQDQLLNRLIKLFGPYAPLVVLLAAGTYAFIKYTEAQNRKLDEINKTFEANFKKILDQANTNFSAILEQSKSGQALYSQLNEVLAKQMVNLSTVSLTQQKFLQDSAGYLEEKLKRVNVDIELKRERDSANAQAAQLLSEKEKLLADAKELRSQIAQVNENLRQIPELRSEISRATSAENKLRQSLVELSRKVQRGDSAEADNLATKYLNAYEADYLPNLLKDIFNPGSPRLQFASRLEGQSATDLRRVIESQRDLGICLLAEYQVNQRSSLLVAGDHNENGLKSVVEIQFNNMNQVRNVVAWSDITTFTIPTSNWFDSMILLVARPQALGGEESLETVRSWVALETTDKINSSALLEAFITGRKATISDPVISRGSDLHFLAAQTESGAIGTSSPVYKLLIGSGTNGTLVRRAIALLQADTIDGISGFSTLPLEVKETLRKAIRAMATRDRPEVMKYSTLGDPNELVEPLLRMTNVVLAPTITDPTTNTPSAPQLIVSYRSSSQSTGIALTSSSAISAGNGGTKSILIRLTPAPTPNSGLVIASLSEIAQTASN